MLHQLGGAGAGVHECTGGARALQLQARHGHWGHALLSPGYEPPSTLNRQHSTLNTQISTLNPQPSPSTLNPQPSTLNPRPSTLGPTLNPQPQGQPRFLNHEPYMGTSLIRNCGPLGSYSRIMPRAL